jgi:cytoskeletal protein RodZ
VENQNIPDNENGTEAQIRELGSKLRRIREAQNLSIAEIANKTKIQKRYLSAIEDGQIELLPKGPYVRSFIRQYCEYLSAGDLWNTYDAITKDEYKNAPSVLNEYEEQSYSDTPKIFKSRSYMWLYLLIAISLGTAAWITWQYRGDLNKVATTPMDGGTTSVVKPDNAEQKQSSSDAGSYSASQDMSSADQSVDLTWMDGVPAENKKLNSSADANTAVKQPVSQTKMLKIVAENGIVWVKISKTGTILFEGILNNGESKEFAVEPGGPVRVRFGNPGKTSLAWDNKTISPVGDGSRPITKYFWSDGSITDNDRTVQ